MHSAVDDGRVGLYAGFCPRVPCGLPIGGHPSRPAVAGRLERSTRRLGRAALERLRRTIANRRPFWPCSGWGLPSHTGHPVCGGLLHRRFTLTSSELLAVCSLWHCPAVRTGSLLTTTLPCGARTFLGGGSPRRRDRPADSSVVPGSLRTHRRSVVQPMS